MDVGKLKVTILGCGTSTGVPLIHCSCEVCTSTDPKNKRLRVSLWIQTADKSFVVDVGPDFRAQALQSKIPRIDAILITHPHYDHIGGLDEIRSYNFLQKEEIPLFAHEWSLRELKQRLPYLFTDTKKKEGGGIAKITLHEFKLADSVFNVQGVQVVPVAMDHGSEQVAGFRIGNFAYLTDCHHIPESSFPRLLNLELLILDCLRLSHHDTHLNFDQAMAYAVKIGAKQTIFTHMSHDFDYDSFSRGLPKSMALAYDGMVINLKENKSP